MADSAVQQPQVKLKLKVGTRPQLPSDASFPQPRKLVSETAIQDQLNLSHPVSQTASLTDDAAASPRTDDSSSRGRPPAYVRGRGHTKRKKREPPPPADPDAMRVALQAALGGGSSKRAYTWTSDRGSSPAPAKPSQTFSKSPDPPAPNYTDAIYIPNVDERGRTRQTVVKQNEEAESKLSPTQSTSPGSTVPTGAESQHDANGQSRPSVATAERQIKAPAQKPPKKKKAPTKRKGDLTGEGYMALTPRKQQHNQWFTSSRKATNPVGQRCKGQAMDSGSTGSADVDRTQLGIACLATW
ncbi:hypothetical protein SpCBS45565_g05758 [Spizellomyces sp. 'palustris']|nr:hypothetical protein SpCBS45565_g05758 [Spizellomyces sp. 'palustris']